MSDMNLDIIQNKLDALVEKIIQKETSDEDFRITYAQILEKINTKMDLFSDTENIDKLAALSLEIKNVIEKRQDVVDGRFAAIKGEFDRINDILISSFKTDDLVSSYNKLDKQLESLGAQQEKQKDKFSQILEFMESFNKLDQTNENLRTNFAIVKEQNVIANENITKQIDILQKVNLQLENANTQTLKDLETILFTLQEFETSLNDDVDNVKEFISGKVDSIIEKIHETDTLMELLNTNMSTMIQVVGNIFEDQEFVDIQSDVTDILTKIAFISEALKKLSEKDDITELQNLINTAFTGLTNAVAENNTKLENKISENKAKIEAIIDENSTKLENRITENEAKLEAKIAENKDSIAETKNFIVDKVTSTISSESIATNEQLSNIASVVSELKTSLLTTKNELSEAILTKQAGKINTALNEMQTKFATQLIQVADNISFEEDFFELRNSIQDCSDELKENISADIECIKEELNALKNYANEANSDIKTLSEGFEALTLGKNDENNNLYTLPDIEADISKIRLDLSKLQKSIMPTENDNETEAGKDVFSKIDGIKEELEKLQNSPINEEIAEVKSLFTSLNEDVSSISKRTNKLILSSDEVNKTLCNNIDGFSDLIKAFDKQSRDFYNSTYFTDLCKKINTITQTSASISQSNKVLNEAFMYLAEWVDSASETFEGLTEDISKIKENIVSDSETEAERITRSLKSLDIRVEEQDAKIEEIENKIDDIDEKINKILTAQNDSKEIKSILEYVASQVSAANEKITVNEKLEQKVLNMEKHLRKIEKNIAIITEYIDDDSDFDIDE